jgi:transposase
MIQTLFSNNYAVFQGDNERIHTDRTVQSRFEESESELQHFPWSPQSPDLNTIEPLWSVLETRVRNRFQPPTSLKQPEDVIEAECYKIPLETVQNLYESIPRRAAPLLKEKCGTAPY